jgi:hypothetical protein
MSPRNEQALHEPHRENNASASHASINRGQNMPPPHQTVRQPIRQHVEVAPSLAQPSTTVQTAPALLPTPSIPPRSSYPIRTNQLKRDKRRRNRRALYQELQELVLGNVHVRVRSDGRVHPFYDKITLRLSPTLLQDERYNYLVERLVPKP